MLKFEKLTFENGGDFESFVKYNPYKIGTYSAGQLIMWSDYFNASYCISDGYFFIRLDIHGETNFMMPFPLTENGHIEEALDIIERYCAEESIPLKFYSVERDYIKYLAQRYPRAEMSCWRNAYDYLYLSEDIREFGGRGYSGQRNHINKFKKLYPDARFCRYTDSYKKSCRRFFKEYSESFSSKGRLGDRELKLAEKMFFSKELPQDCRGIVLDGKKVISVCYGDITGEVLVIHIEKSLDGYEGVYPFMVQSFAKEFSMGVKYINREDDAGVKGLRISKTQYRPAEIVTKINYNVYSELHRIETEPVIKTERLVLDAVRKKDIEDYSRLCLDDERNRFWGYDYRKDLKGKLTKSYFYNTVKTDFEKRTSLSLAIRYNKKFIGEVVLYAFNGRGNALAGVRIFKEYEGMGLAKEAFDAVIDYAIYKLQLLSVTAYCYKENTRSARMLSSLMTKIKEDETYTYFERKY